jgi:hypothetical protein
MRGSRLPAINFQKTSKREDSLLRPGSLAVDALPVVGSFFRRTDQHLLGRMRCHPVVGQHFFDKLCEIHVPVEAEHIPRAATTAHAASGSVVLSRQKSAAGSRRATNWGLKAAVPMPQWAAQKIFSHSCILFLPVELRFVNSSLPRVFGRTLYHVSVVFLSPDISKGQRETFFEMNMHTDIHATAVSTGDAAAVCPQQN